MKVSAWGSREISLIDRFVVMKVELNGYRGQDKENIETGAKFW